MRAAPAVISYVLIAAAIYLALGWLAARITAAQLLNQAQQQLARVEAHQPLWEWHLRKPRDLIASRAFGNAKVSSGEDGLNITSADGTPFELGLPIAWALDLRHWPILQMQLESGASGTLGLIWQSAGKTPACLAPLAGTLTPNIQTLRIDLRDLTWYAPNGDACPGPTVAAMLRLRIQIPADARLHLTSVSLLTTEPLAPPQDTSVNLPEHATAADIERAIAPAQNWPMPLFRLPSGLNAEAMLTLRDGLRERWPAALIVTAGVTPQPIFNASHAALEWTACMIYLLALVWLALKPIKGPLRPWLEIAGCLLGPLWLVVGLHWGLYPTALGVTAFVGGLVFAATVERHHLPRLWRWPEARRDWLWPLAPLPFAILLIVFYGHVLHPLPLGHVLTYFGWAWLQQWLMLVVLLRRFELIVPRPRWAIMAVATVFALLHTPNGMLMQCCFVAELWWAWCFQRSRSVLPIGLAHAACALLVEAGLIGGLMRSLEVSARFFF
jgi:hypothetical protein